MHLNSFYESFTIFSRFLLVVGKHDPPSEDEEGTTSIHIDSQVSSTLQQIIDAWAYQTKVHALLQPTPTICVTLPRFVDRAKIRDHITLAKTVSLPVFSGFDTAVSSHTYCLRSAILHIGSETPQATIEP